jgi:multidrug efflux system outer membrane protein
MLRSPKLRSKDKNMKSIIKKLVTLLIFVTLTGCTLGPNYIRPEVMTPVAYKTESPWKEATPQDAAEKGRWWEIFGDPTLTVLEEKAMAANQELRVALNRVLQVRAGERFSRADQRPRIDLDGSATREHLSADFSATGQGGTGNIYRLPFDLGYEIDLWGRVRRSVEAAEADTESAMADYRTVLLSLQAEVARNYFSLRALDKEIALLEQTAVLREDARDLIKRQYDNGRVSQLALAQAETQLAGTRAEAIGLQKQRGELENALAVLVGQPASNFVLPAAPLDLIPPVVASGLPSSLLERRPDVAAAERQMASASARIGVAETAFFPAISLTGSAGFASTDLEDLFSWNNRIWGIGPAISLPIFDGGRNNANLDRAKAAYEEAVASYRQQVLVAFQEVEDGLRGLEILARQGAMLQQAVVAAEQAWKISENRYRYGLVSYLEVVDSQRTALRAQRSITQLQGQQLTTCVLLIKALGGGWGG